MKVQEIPIDQIDVGERRRKDFGDIAALAKGIERVGLLHPIVVDRNGSGRYRLIAGARRLQAIKLLKLTTIAAHLRAHMTDEELRDVELEEDTNRKDLTHAERTTTLRSSQKLVEDARKARDIISAKSAEKTETRGRKSKHGVAREEIAAAVGVAETTLREAEEHIDTVERFPWMKGSEWRRSHVLAVGEAMERLPEPEHDQVVGVLACAQLMDPALAQELIEKISKKPKGEREEIYTLSQSQNPRERSLALTKAKELPPMPDPRISHLANAASALGHAIEYAPDDPIVERLQGMRKELKAIRKTLQTIQPEGSQTIQ